MKKIVKVLAVILCIATLLSSMSIFGFAEDEQNPETETTVTEETEPEKVIFTYPEMIKGTTELGMRLIKESIKIPANAMVLGAIPPLMLLLPVILPASVVGLAGEALAGLLLMAFSPIVGFVLYSAQ